MVHSQNPHGKPKRVRRALRLEFCEYVVAINGWDWSYSLSIDTSRDRIDPYHEFKHLVVKGSLLRPSQLGVDHVEVTLLPDPKLDFGRREKHEPFSVGRLEVRQTGMFGNILMPMDALVPILQMVSADHFKYLSMSGTELYRRSTPLTGFSLESAMDDP